MKKTVLIIAAILLTGLGAKAQGNLTASQILNKAVNTISNSKGVNATFIISNSGYTGKGEIKTSGNKFTVKLPDGEVWFNGKDLFTYNKRSGETTIVAPNAQELAESNPLAYITNAPKNYNVSYSTVKKAGKYVLELLPKTKSEEIKRITLTLRQGDFSPEKIVVEPRKGSPVSADINSFKTGVSTSLSEFEYPKAKYPNVEIIDLR